jgi:hypothetical protein
VVGYYRGKDLLYVARARNGLVPATRRTVYEKLKSLITDKCPFVNLPETGRARWGEILDAEMKKCVSLARIHRTISSRTAEWFLAPIQRYQDLKFESSL